MRLVIATLALVALPSFAEPIQPQGTPPSASFNRLNTY